MKSSISQIIIMIFFVSSLISCNSKSNNNETSVKSDETVIQKDSTTLLIDINEVDSIKLLFGDDTNSAYLNEGDLKKLSELLSYSKYDTAWNDSGIMVKMITPDYTLIINHINLNTDYDDWVMIWKNNGRTKFNNKWYIIDDRKKDEIYELIESYR